MIDVVNCLFFTLLILMAMVFFRAAFVSLFEEFQIAKYDQHPICCIVIGLLAFSINSTMGLVILNFAMNVATDGQWGRYVVFAGS